MIIRLTSATETTSDCRAK